MELFPFVIFGMHTFFIGEHSILLQNRRLCAPTSRRLADSKPVGLCESVNLFRIHAVSERYKHSAQLFYHSLHAKMLMVQQRQKICIFPFWRERGTIRLGGWWKVESCL